METFKDKIVVVTGGAGFVGSHIVDALVERGARVRVIDDLSTGKIENLAHIIERIEFVKDSILNDQALAAIFKDADVVYHEAAVPSVPKSLKDPLTSHEANATGTLKVLLNARDAKVKRVIYAGSSSYYGDTPTLPKHEGMPPNPLSPYGLQKYVSEAYMQQFAKYFGMETIGLRYFNVYGPRQNPESEYAAVIPRFIKLMKHGQKPKVFGDGTATRGYTYISDAVAANMLAFDATGVSGEIFNVAGEGQTSVNELIALINKVLGTSIEAEYTPNRPGDIKHSYADLTKSRRMLGYEPKVSLEEGLRLTKESIS
ncbi:MAG TPA: SDR family oxidoreductase [Candidatus Paceibacterota bacterium]|nr:SDR family oxidoreductase [Candidatus Paceibacterota bacterium]